MKVFISWSGKDSISQKVAIELSTWLPTIIQDVVTWVSTDIASGDRWNDAINKSLSESGMGIICVTKENYRAPWLNFEAGAIAKGLTNNKVVPLLINLKPSDLVDSPLIQFQAKSLDKDNIKELLLDINNLCDRNISKDAIVKLFEHLWDDLKDTIDNIIDQTPEITKEKEREKRPTEEILEEVLSLTREIRNELSYNKLDNVDLGRIIKAYQGNDDKHDITKIWYKYNSDIKKDWTKEDVISVIRNMIRAGIEKSYIIEMILNSKYNITPQEVDDIYKSEGK